MTTTVTFAFKSPDDAPLPGVQIVATLSSYIVNGGVVLPAEVLDVTDAQGLAVMDLHPNTGAAEGTTYTFKLTIPGVVRPSYFRRISVPDQDTISFEEMLGGSTPPVTGDLYVLAGYVDDDYVTDAAPGPYVLTDYVASGYVQP